MPYSFRKIAPALLACAVILAGFCFLYFSDNKYTASAPIDPDGAADVSGALLGENPLFLANGWRAAPQTEPSAATGGALGKTVSIGEYSNFSLLNPDGSPYGTVRYTIRLRGEGQACLYLPEVFCAYRVYADGTPLGGEGSLDPYLPRVRDAVYAFPIHGEATLVIQAANYTHYYGGIYYPPAIGTPAAISLMIARRVGIYGFLCFSALSIALFSLAIWLGAKGRRDKLQLLFGMLCLSFAGRMCYPFLHLEGAGPIHLVYALEDLCSLLSIFFGTRIVEALCGLENIRRLRTVTVPVTAAMCAVGAFLPLLALPALPAFIPAYGQLISWYKLAAAAYLVAAAVYGLLSGAVHSPFLLAGTAVSGAGLLAGVLSINKFEPVCGAWPDEYGAFAMVLLFAGMMALRSRRLLEENLRLTEHLHEEVEEKTRKLKELADERKSLLAGMIHDLKSPLTLILNYARFIEGNGILVDAETRAQAAVIRQKCSDMTGRVKAMQKIAVEDSLSSTEFQPLDLSALLRDFYELNKDDISVVGPQFVLKCPVGCVTVEGHRESLERILENLVYNALDFTPPDGKITLRLWVEASAAISVTDTGSGIAPENLERVFDRFFTTRPETGGDRGMGLYAARQLAREHGGSLTVSSVPGKGTEFILRLPLSKQDLF